MQIREVRVQICEFLRRSVSSFQRRNVERRKQSVCRRTHVQLKPWCHYDGKHGQFGRTGQGIMILSEHLLNTRKINVMKYSS